MEINVERAAARGFRKMPKEAAEALMTGLEAIAAGQVEGLDIKHMKGTAASYRLRQGDWRAVYRIADNELWVEKAGHRREIYR
jgi:mRNA-degrading endonuclease RelE of RelBE toxin-antitoxin system